MSRLLLSLLAALNCCIVWAGNSFHYGLNTPEDLYEACKLWKRNSYSSSIAELVHRDARCYGYFSGYMHALRAIQILAIEPGNSVVHTYCLPKNLSSKDLQDWYIGWYEGKSDEIKRKRIDLILYQAITDRFPQDKSEDCQ